MRSDPDSFVSGACGGSMATGLLVAVLLGAPPVVWVPLLVALAYVVWSEWS